jgi:hypothetical protein
LRSLLFRSPIATGLGVFFLSFGAITLIRVLVEGHLYFGRWLAFNLGDSIFLPLYGFFVAFVLRDKPIRGFQGRWWWFILLVAVGLSVSIVLEIQAHSAGRDPQIAWLPSQLYHTLVVLPVLSAFVIWTALVIITQHRTPVWAVLACAISLAGWVGTSVYDSTPAQRNPPETLVDGKRV